MREVSMGEKINALVKVLAGCAYTMATILAKGDRVELIPIKDGIRVIRVKREEVKTK
jgi:hypothetical protein